MRSALNFARDLGLFFVIAMVLMALMIVGWFAAVFHGLNYLCGAKR